MLLPLSPALLLLSQSPLLLLALVPGLLCAPPLK
jgi:hypothetical protein